MCRGLIEGTFAFDKVALLLRSTNTEDEQARCKKQRSVLINRLARQHLRDQFVFDIDMRRVAVMVGMTAEIFEMHGHRRFLAIEAQVAVNIADAGQYQQH